MVRIPILIIYYRLNGYLLFGPPPFRIPRQHMLISSACQGYSFEKVPLPKHHVASYTYQYRMRWRHIVAVASSACRSYSFDKVPLIKHHVTSYTYQYRKRWRHDVTVATFVFPYTPPKTYTRQYMLASFGTKFRLFRVEFGLFLRMCILIWLVCLLGSCGLQPRSILSVWSHWGDLSNTLKVHCLNPSVAVLSGRCDVNP